MFALFVLLAFFITLAYLCTEAQWGSHLIFKTKLLSDHQFYVSLSLHHGTEWLTDQNRSSSGTSSPSFVGEQVAPSTRAQDRNGWQQFSFVPKIGGLSSSSMT